MWGRKRIEGTLEYKAVPQDTRISLTVKGIGGLERIRRDLAVESIEATPRGKGTFTVKVTLDQFKRLQDVLAVEALTDRYGKTEV